MTRAGMALGPHGLAYIAHGARRYLEAKLQQQLVGNTFLPPGWIVTSYLADQCLQGRRPEA